MDVRHIGKRRLFGPELIDSGQGELPCQRCIFALPDKVVSLSSLVYSSFSSSFSLRIRQTLAGLLCFQEQLPTEVGVARSMGMLGSWGEFGSDKLLPEHWNTGSLGWCKEGERRIIIGLWCYSLWGKESGLGRKRNDELQLEETGSGGFRFLGY